MTFPVSLFDEKGKLHLLSYLVTRCDWCGTALGEDYTEIDNAIRVLYFCSKKCKGEFDVRYPPNTNSYPRIKLTIKGLDVPLKFYDTEAVEGKETQQGPTVDDIIKHIKKKRDKLNC